jgi:hypothetical protein
VIINKLKHYIVNYYLTYEKVKVNEMRHFNKEEQAFKLIMHKAWQDNTEDPNSDRALFTKLDFSNESLGELGITDADFIDCILPSNKPPICCRKHKELP